MDYNLEDLFFIQFYCYNFNKIWCFFNLMNIINLL